MRRVLNGLLILSLLLSLSLGALADSLSEGKELYRAGKYAEAAAKLEQATKEDPKNARAWWQLNFAYHKLGKDTEAIGAVQKAGEADPGHSFASEPGKYESILATRQKASGAGMRTPVQPMRQGSSTTAGSGRGNITQQLLTGDVYAEPGMNVDVARLQQVAAELRPTVVKFVIFNSKSNSRTLDREADRIRNYLAGQINRGHGYVIAASRSAIAVSSDSINKNDLKSLTSQVAPSMEAGDYTGGLERLARGLAKEKPRNEAPVSARNGGIPTVAHGPNWFLIFIAIVGGGAILWIISRRISNARAMSAMREPLERQKSEVISQLNFLEDSANIAEGAAASQAKQARIAAGTKLDQAARIISHAKTEQDLGRAQVLLDQAQADIQRGKAALDGTLQVGPATGSTGGVVPPVYPASQQSTAQTDWSSIPNQDRGVCFFCSRPSMLSELTPVTVNLDGNPQKVLACPTDLSTIKSGAMPQIRAFQQGGQYVPWYAYNNYDPYRDYYSRGYDRSFLTDMIMFSAIDHMFWNWHHPMGWGWGGYGGWGGGNTYVFYPDHENYHDYYSQHAAAGGDFDRDIDAGGTDFLQGSGGDLGGGGGGDLGRDQS